MLTDVSFQNFRHQAIYGAPDRGDLLEDSRTFCFITTTAMIMGTMPIIITI